MGYIEKENEIIREELEQCMEYKSMYKVVSELMSQNGKDSVAEYIAHNHINKVLIYGAGCIGKVLADALSIIEECQIIGVVDKSHNTEYGFENFIDVEKLNSTDFDICVVTPIKAYESIVSNLENNGISNYCNVMELLDYKRRAKLYGTGLFV